MSFLSTLSDNFRQLSVSSENADVILLVGKDKVIRHAHSLILSARSAFFSRVIASKPKVPGDGTIYLSAVDPEAIDHVLEYIYAGQCTFTMEAVPKLAAAANELELHELKTGCEEYARKNLTDENVCTMLAAADRNSMTFLRAAALEHIFHNASAVLKSKGLLSLDQDLFMEILVSDELTVDELEVWGAVVRWGLAQCDQNHHDSEFLKFPAYPGRLVVMPVYEEYDKIASSPAPPSGTTVSKEDGLVYKSVADHTNLRNAVAPLLGLVRFHLIPSGSFCRLIEGTGLLPCDLALKVYRHHVVSPDIHGCRLPLSERRKCKASIFS